MHKAYQQTAFWNDLGPGKQKSIQQWIDTTGAKSEELFTRVANALSEGGDMDSAQYKNDFAEFSAAMTALGGNGGAAPDAPPADAPGGEPDVEQAVDELLDDEVPPED